MRYRKRSLRYIFICCEKFVKNVMYFKFNSKLKLEQFIQAQVN